MVFKTAYKTKRFWPLCFIILLASLSSSAQLMELNSASTSGLRYKRGLSKSIFGEFNRHNFGVEFNAGIQPSATIETLEGGYKLNSSLQHCYKLGIKYQINRDSAFKLFSGLYVGLNQSHYFLQIPDADIRGFLLSGGAPQIEDKEVYFKVSVPLRVGYQFLKSRNPWELGVGLNVNYSGFNNDEKVQMSLADSNFRLVKIFSADFQSNNDLKPWVSFTAEIAKNFYLKNRNALSIHLIGELSSVAFINGNYEITVPNIPVTKGKYAATGSYVGLGITYLFLNSFKTLPEAVFD